MNTLTERPRRAPDSGRFDASAVWLALLAQRRDPVRHLDAPVELPCQLYDPELWFAAAPADLEQAKALCSGCPVQRACLIGALDRREPAGVWGGQIFVHGRIVSHKRPRGRPAKRAFSTT